MQINPISLIIYGTALFIGMASFLGFNSAADIFQSLGVGFGSLFAALGGLTAFLDWRAKRAEEEHRVRFYRNRFPRRLLRETFKIAALEYTDPVYILDYNTHIKHWIKDQKTRKNLGFHSTDTEYIKKDEFDLYREGEEIGVFE